MVGVIAILGFFSIVIYLSGLIMGSVGEKESGEETGREGEREKKESVIKTARATEGEMEEELKKVAAIAAVTAMLESSKAVPQKSSVSERRRERKARYPSPWMMVRE